MNIPLGLALTEFIAETGYPTIAHHHDFFWERRRFLANCVGDYLSMSFPPTLPSIRHVAISSWAASQLSLRTGISATIIPNVMDFASPPSPPDGYVADLREALGVPAGCLLILQPTRVVQRKGIEHAIELCKRLKLNTRLVISHASGDEGNVYERRVREFAAMLGVTVNFEADIIKAQRGLTANGKKVYALSDVYPQADLVTYPSDFEGFGNAFLEAIYFRRPLVVNNYSIYSIDIKPKGFHVVEFDGFISDVTVQMAERVLTDSGLAQRMTEHNYQIARRHYSFEVLERRLTTLLADCFGEAD
jgi:glycosyltransferase involved in cell wall biosynthesis